MPPYLRQDDAPVYPKVLFNRPVTRGGAGRLLIPGGHTGELSQPMTMFELAMAGGAGECVMALPDVLVKLLSGAPSATFVASSPSGSLGREALGRLLELSEDADAVALGVSLSNNSETAILVENLLREVERPVVAFGETLTIIRTSLSTLTDQSSNLIVATMPEVFKLADALDVRIRIRPNGGLTNKLEIVASVAAQMKASLLVYGTEIIVAYPGQELIVTPVDYRLSQYPTLYYALATVFWMQNRELRREGLATASFVASRVSRGLSYDHHATAAELAKLITRELEAHSGF